MRDTAAFLTSLLSDNEINASWHNVQARVDGFIAVYTTLEEALAALKRTQSELVAYVRSLPTDFVAQTPTYTRVGLSLLTGAGHPRLHFRQIREAVAAARLSDSWMTCSARSYQHPQPSHAADRSVGLPTLYLHTHHWAGTCSSAR